METYADALHIISEYRCATQCKDSPRCTRVVSSAQFSLRSFVMCGYGSYYAAIVCTPMAFCFVHVATLLSHAHMELAELLCRVKQEMTR